MNYLKTAKVRILKEIYQPGIGTWKLGDVVELTKRDAAYLVKNGAAEYIDTPEKGIQPKTGEPIKPEEEPKAAQLEKEEVEKRLMEEVKGPRLSKTSNGKSVIALEQEGLYLDIDYDFKEWKFAVRDFRSPPSPHCTYTVKLDAPPKLITSKLAKPIRDAIKTLYDDHHQALNRIIYLIQQHEYTFEPDLAPDQEEEEEKPSPAEAMIDLALGHGLTFFQDQFKDAYTYLKTSQKNSGDSDVTDDSPRCIGHGDSHTQPMENGVNLNSLCVSGGGYNNKECNVSNVSNTPKAVEVWQVHRLRSRFVGDYLSRLSHQMTGKAIGGDHLNSAIRVLSGRAQTEPKVWLWNRVAPDGEGGLWLDMSNDRWEAIHVTREGWEIVSRPPILFRRYPHQKPMVRPVPGGSLAPFLDFCNLSSVDDQLLFLVTAIHYLIPDFPHIGVCLWGTHGSVKSTQQRVVKSLIDPSSVGLLSMPSEKDMNEMIQQMDHHYLPFYDNVTSVNDAQSDTLCRGITGAGNQRRALYTDDDTVLREYRRCVNLNGINVPAGNPDLLSRLIVMECPYLPEAYRRSETELEAEFNKKAPMILGAFLDTIVKALNIYPRMEKSVRMLPRMADAALWCCAITEALGLGWQAFLNAYRVNIGEVEESTVRSSPIGGPLLALLEVVLKDRDTVSVTSQKLLTMLKQYAEDEGQNLKQGDFPPDAIRLSKELNKIKANLPKLGYHLRDKRESDGSRSKVFTRIKSTKLTEDYTPTQSHQNIWRAEDLRHILDPESYRRDGSRTRDGERALEISEPEWFPTRDMDVEHPADPGSSEGETAPEIQDSRKFPDIPVSSEEGEAEPDDVEESKPAQDALGDTVEPDDPRIGEIVAYIAKNGGKYTADQIAYRCSGIPRPIFDRMLARAREVGLVYVNTEGRWFGK